MSSVELEGTGLHSGVRSRVRFSRAPGPLTLRRGGVAARLDELVFDGASRSTTASTADGRLRVGTVEHVFAALGAAAIRDGISIAVDGPEMPLVDGGSLAFVLALERLDPVRSPPSLVVVRDGVLAVGESQYVFTPSQGVHLEVAIDFDDARLAPTAEWRGDPGDFRERIAPARTFGFAHEIDELARRGLASHVAPESVVVVAPDRVFSAGRPFRADEPARHKLLDLIGDLYGHGGPPEGSVRATRPGHAATHEVVGRALSEGILARRTSE